MIQNDGEFVTSFGELKAKSNQETLNFRVRDNLKFMREHANNAFPFC